MQMWHTGENNEKTWTLEKKKKAKSKGTRTEVVKEVAAAGSGYNSVFSVLMGTELESVVVKVCGKKKKKVRNMNWAINTHFSLKFCDQQLKLLEIS